MNEALYRYYEQELDFIRSIAGEFAAAYPDDAGRLLLESGKSRDPHVERLIEAFALIAARTQQRVDDGYPELSDALLHNLHPQFLAPIPSMTMVQIEPDPQRARIRSGVRVERGSRLLTKSVQGVRCKFTTSLDVTVWPLAVESVQMDTPDAEDLRADPDIKTALLVTLRTRGGEPLSSYTIPSLTFHHPWSTGGRALFEALHRDCSSVEFRLQDTPLKRSDGKRSRIEPVGFARDESLLHTESRISSAYRLLQEYFAFPQKFMFSRLVDIPDFPEGWTANSLQLRFLLRDTRKPIADGLHKDQFLLGCTPAINEFPHDASPITVNHRLVEQPVHADVRQPTAYEVLSIEDVRSSIPGSNETVEFRSFFALEHGDPPDSDIPFWHSRRKPSKRQDDPGTEVYLALVDPDFGPAKVGRFEVLHLKTRCSNRNLPSSLVLADPNGDFTLEGAAEIASVCSLSSKPTEPRRLPPHNSSRWRLVSQMSLNHLSLVRDTEQRKTSNDRAAPNKALETLREILSLYDYTQTERIDRRITGIIDLDANLTTRMMLDSGPVRGVQIDIEFDESCYRDTSLYLFASVLERFFALQVSVNSFTLTRARSTQRNDEEELLGQWPPRTGESPIL